MLTISKAISSGQAQSYHKLEYTSNAQSYYKEGESVKGEWQGKLAASLGLSGEVGPMEFSRLSEGKHPQTEAQMVKHRPAQEYGNADGSTTKAIEHRAAWDATFSAPKSISVTALVGGDERVRAAHYAAVTVALSALERYTQARLGGNNPAETTGKFIAARFEHDTARPVDGYAAPQLHTHVLIFNVTERADGTTRALQPQSLFESQQYATAVLPGRAHLPAPEAGLRDRNGTQQRSGDQGLFAGVPRRLEPAIATDQRPTGEVRLQRAGGRAYRGSLDPRPEADPHAAGGPGRSQRDGGGAWEPAAAGDRRCPPAGRAAEQTAQNVHTRERGGDVCQGEPV